MTMGFTGNPPAPELEQADTASLADDDTTTTVPEPPLLTIEADTTGVWVTHEGSAYRLDVFGLDDFEPISPRDMALMRAVLEHSLSTLNQAMEIAR